VAGPAAARGGQWGFSEFFQTSFGLVIAGLGGYFVVDYPGLGNALMFGAGVAVATEPTIRQLRRLRRLGAGVSRRRPTG
jgi:hypothetical protein